MPRGLRHATRANGVLAMCVLLFQVAVNLGVGTVSVGVTDLHIASDASIDPKHRVAHLMQHFVDVFV